MITTPITNSHFNDRVEQLLSAAVNDGKRGQHTAAPIVPQLTYSDTPLSPAGFIAGLLAMSSSWIDLCSPDPIVANVSKQVLFMEVAYAAFCGIECIFIPGPRLYHRDVSTRGMLQYARAILECLAIGSHMQFHIMLPMIDHADHEQSLPLNDLAIHVRDEYLDSAEERQKITDQYGTWDAWNTIRTTCKYHSRLFVGKK